MAEFPVRTDDLPAFGALLTPGKVADPYPLGYVAAPASLLAFISNTRVTER
jgi:hypothetical protein